MNLKELLEKRTAKQAEMKAILDMAKSETRSLTEEESTKFDELEKEIRELDATIRAYQTSRELEAEAPEVENEVEERDMRTQEQREYDAFDAYIRGQVEERTDPVNMTKGDNGAVVPASIANKIIENVLDICPIYQDADRYNVKGTLSIPYYDETTQGDITMAYADEFVELESKAGKFTSVDLGNFLAGALVKIGKSLVANTDIDLENKVVELVAEAVAKFEEGECLHGTVGKVAGLSGVTLGVNAASATAITADELIKLKNKIKKRFRKGAKWIMSNDTLTAIELLKDGEDRFIFRDDMN